MTNDSEQMDEAEIIELLTQGMIFNDKGVVLGAGDDCAILESGDGRVVLITTDMQLEGVHFRRGYAQAEELGHRALAINLSDVAAMGGTPRHGFLALAVPGDAANTSFLQRFRAGMASLANEFGVNLLGGDLSRSESGIKITITVIGEADAERVLLRSDAQPGDHLYVTGTLGDAAAGLELLNRSIAPGQRGPLEQAQLTPQPRVREGQFLSRSGLVRSCIDLSDGLSTDLSHLCERSGVGAVVMEDRLPLSAELLEHVGGDARRRIDLACHGGEDYELCFTVAPENADELEREFAAAFETRLTRVGEMRNQPREIDLVTRSGRQTLAARGHDHFARH